MSEPPGDAQNLASRLLAVTAQHHHAVALATVRAVVADVLGFDDPMELDPTAAFASLGVDSVAGLEIALALSREVGAELSATLGFEYPTLEAVAGHVVRLLVPVAEPPAEPSPTIPQSARSASVAPPRRRGCAGSELEADTAAALEPGTAEQDDWIAVVGMGCRLPGGITSPDDLWRLVSDGTDAITPWPHDRGWDHDELYDPTGARPGTSCTDRGGFLHEAARFDADFFGVSPREALATDPQHRLLLEVAWETLEDAGIVPDRQRGSATGVFVGAMYQDYGLLADSPPADLRGYLGIGSALSLASGRISYVLGLQGPALTIDTACSSSLVALHLATQSLRRHECDLALAGGATVMASPSLFVEFSRQRGLAPDGRCKAFGADADGTGWAEGVALVALQRLGDARRAGRRVLAVIRGTAVNQDGASNGLTAPNPLSQEQVIRAALIDAGLRPADVDAVEAHGTGTRLGDPVEARALLAAYSQDRDRGRPLLIGSLKSNIGHTQAAAGVASVIKIVQALQHRRLPRTLHADTPNPLADWSTGHLQLLQEEQAWEPGPRRRRAGVSAFGISGTNAHVIIEESPGPVRHSDGPPTGASGVPVTWPLCAPSSDALLRQARQLLAHLEQHQQLPPAGVGATLTFQRSVSRHRAVIVGGTQAELLDGLRSLAAMPTTQSGSPGSHHHGDRVVLGVDAGGGTAFIFPGQGSQRPGAGRQLYTTFPAFAAALDQVSEAFGKYLDLPLLDVIWAREGSSHAALLDRTEYAQPAVFGLGVALAALLSSWGVHPDRVLGHSLGELTAACVAGVFPLDDAARLVAVRGQLMGALTVEGAMVALPFTEQDVTVHLTGWSEHLAIAAVNGPAATVVSGDRGKIREWLTQWQQAHERARYLRTSHAFHSPAMDPVVAQVAEAVRDCRRLAPQVPLVSGLTGELTTASELASPDYWARQTREPVRFGDALAQLARSGVTRTVELGPDAVLTALAASTRCGRRGLPLSAAAVIRRGRPEPVTAVAALAQLYADGATVTWETVHAAAEPVRLPTYAFDHDQSYWLPRTGTRAATGAVAVDVGDQLGHHLADDHHAEDDGRDGLASGQGRWERLPEEQREQAAVMLVMHHTAAVLGHTVTADVDPHRSFAELGLDSLAATDLVGRLAQALGVPVQPTAILDHPDPGRLARHLLAVPRPTRPTDDGPSGTASTPAVTLSTILQRAHRDGGLLEIPGLLSAAARFQPAFSCRSEWTGSVEPLVLAEGRRHPRGGTERSAAPLHLICLPSFLPGSGARQFMRLARAFHDAYRVTAVDLPGLAAGTPVPGSGGALVDVLIDSILAAAGSAPFVLVGHSAGGAICHAVATALQARGEPPTAVGLLDTLWVADPRASSAVFATAMGKIMNRAHALVRIDDDVLMRLGAYLRLLDGWSPERLEVPELLLRAGDPLDPGEPWQLADCVETVPGDHFSLLEADVPQVATRLRDWLIKQHG